MLRALSFPCGHLLDGLHHVVCVHTASQMRFDVAVEHPVVRKKEATLSGLLHQAIFMMQAAKHRCLGSIAKTMFETSAMFYGFHQRPYL